MTVECMRACIETYRMAATEAIGALFCKVMTPKRHYRSGARMESLLMSLPLVGRWASTFTSGARSAATILELLRNPDAWAWECHRQGYLSQKEKTHGQS
jgi:hypothetical protein